MRKILIYTLLLLLVSSPAWAIRAVITGGTIDNTTIGATTPTTGVFTTVNTGQGAYELYQMDQNVHTGASPTFVQVTLGNGAVVSNGTDGTLTITEGGESLTIAFTSNTATFGSTTDISSIGFGALNLVTTGTISGAVPILDNVSGPTAAQMYGSLNVVNANITVLLPTAVAGMSGCVLDSGTAHDVIVDVQSGDDIEMTAGQQTNGLGITNASGSSTADFVCVIAPSAGHWVVMGSRGTWASQ